MPAQTRTHTTRIEPYFYSSQSTLTSRRSAESVCTFYVFGFNGQEMDNEITGSTGTTYTAADWEYDARIGQRWNIDPLYKKFPSQSPYACFNGNPILFADPTGQSGIVTKDDNAKTITVTQAIVLYGSKASPELAKQTASDIQTAWNSANGKVMINGEEYSVNFKVYGVYMDEDKYKEEVFGFELSNGLEALIESNKSYALNFFRVEDVTNDPREGSYASDAGSNTGEFQYKQLIASGSTTEPHEIGHGFGLDHDVLPDGNEKQDFRGEGQPHIMVQRGCLVDPKYTASWGTVDAEKRAVTQKNIDDLHLESVKFDKYGNGSIGKLTNRYYRKNGRNK